MSDRELRDEIEQLSAELREARRQLDFTNSVSGGAEQLRLLTAELVAAKAQYKVLKQQIPASEALLAARKEEAEILKAELMNLRKQIADLDPLPNPYDATQPDWSLEQSQTPGCLQLVLVFGALGLSSAARQAVRGGLLILVLWSGAAAAQVDPDPWFGADKALHFSFSAGLSGIGYGGTALFTEDRNVRVAVSAGFALGLGIAKELADLAGLWGHPSWRDFAWDVAGTAVGVLVSWALDRFVFTPLFPPRPAAERPSFQLVP